MALPKGRQTIRKHEPTFVTRDPSAPQVGRENRRVRLWDLEAKPGSTIAKLEQCYLAALDAVDKIGEHKVDAARSNRFTPEGLKGDALNFALKNLVPEFKRGRTAITKAKQEAAALRDKIKLQPADKADVVGFLMRQEIRGWLRSMPPDQRDNYLAKNIDRLDPTVALAVLEVPADLGVAPASVRNLMHDRALEAQHGQTVTDLHELEHAIEVAESAVETGRDEVRQEAGVLDPHEFDKLAAPVEAVHAAPWLRRHVEEGGVEVVRVVDVERGIERKATPAEIEIGVFYKDHDHFIRKEAAA